MSVTDAPPVEPTEATRARRARVCCRCGIDWIDTGDKYLRTAPCKDCRPIMKRDGHDPNDWIRPKIRSTT